MRYRVGLVGVRRGSSLVRPFEVFPETTITALCDLDERRLAETGQALGIAEGGLFSEYEALLASDVDIIVVGTPIPFHAEQAIRAMEAGKHVLSEVTAAATLEDCARIVEAARRTGQVYMMAENSCYVHYIREWQVLVGAGRLGAIFYAECEYIHNIQHLLFDDSSGESYWRLQRPPITYCSHSLGPVLQLMDDRIVQVSCVDAGTSILGRSEPGCLNMQVALCKTAKGGVIKLLRSQVARRAPPLHYYSLYGTKGFIEHDHSRGHGTMSGRLYIEGEHAPEQGFEVIDCPESDPSAPPEALSGGHGTSEYFLIRDFIDAVVQNVRPPIDAVRAAEFTAPGLCAHESSLHGGAWVDVPQFVM
jgi:predicted dehydrogenase